MNTTTRIALVQGDITTVAADALVNPANTDLLHGGGLAAIIAEKGGAIVTNESERLSPIPIGEAAVTDAGKLPAHYIIHAASMTLGGVTTEEHLRRALINVYKRTSELGIKTIAIPSIGTGIGGFPVQRAAVLQMEAAKVFLDAHPEFQQITFVLHGDADLQAYQAAYNNQFVHEHDQ